jgi:hypothetical protein
MNGHDSPPGGRGASPRQDITDPATGGSRLLSRKCATCILRPRDPMHLGPERLREIIGPALAAGSFVVCHDTLTYGDFPDYGPAICRGFYDAYAERSPALIFLRSWRRLVEVPPPEAAGPGPAAAGPGRAKPHTLPAARQAAPRPAGSPHDHHQERMP